jgi:hypothetical protein
MDKDYLQALRHKLQKRVYRLNSSDHQIFHATLKQFWGFIRENSLLLGIMEQLESLATAQVIEKVEKILSDDHLSYAEDITFDCERDNATACYLVIKKCVESTKNIIETEVANKYSQENQLDKLLEVFKDIFLEPFYEYLDESLDDRGAILALLKKYKHRCEWFHKEKLYHEWESNTKGGEKHLALDLYEYLFDQGIDLAIEPRSLPSGEPDLVSSQIGENRLVVDAKIFNKDKGKQYIIHGFRQIYNYVMDYNQPVGYLIIFKTCEEDLKLSLQETASHIPFHVHNHKTIFFLTIDLFPYEASASKRGILRSIEISSSDLILAEEPTTDSGAA